MSVSQKRLSVLESSSLTLIIWPSLRHRRGRPEDAAAAVPGPGEEREVQHPRVPGQGPQWISPALRLLQVDLIT